MSPTRFHENIAELTIQLFERPLDAKLQTWLNAEHGPSSPAYDRLKHACETGVAADWLVCPPGSALMLYLLPEGRIDFSR